MPFNKQAKFLGHGYKANIQHWRSMNHALKVVYLAGIPRISFTANYFNLNNKFPKDLEGLLPQFKSTVLKPCVSQLMTSMNSLKTLHKEVSLLIETPENISSVLSSFDHQNILRTTSFNEETKQNEIIYVWKHNGNKVDYDYFNLPPMLARQLKFSYDCAYSTIVVAEANNILEQLSGALDLVHDLNKIKTMDQALEVYIKLLKERATTDVSVLKLSKIIMRKQGKLPFQARLFRSWSRLTHRLARLAGNSNSDVNSDNKSK